MSSAISILAQCNAKVRLLLSLKAGKQVRLKLDKPLFLFFSLLLVDLSKKLQTSERDSKLLDA